MHIKEILNKIKKDWIDKFERLIQSLWTRLTIDADYSHWIISEILDKVKRSIERWDTYDSCTWSIDKDKLLLTTNKIRTSWIVCKFNKNAKAATNKSIHSAINKAIKEIKKRNISKWLAVYNIIELISKVRDEWEFQQYKDYIKFDIRSLIEYRSNKISKKKFIHLLHKASFITKEKDIPTTDCDTRTQRNPPDSIGSYVQMAQEGIRGSRERDTSSITSPTEEPTTHSAVDYLSNTISLADYLGESQLEVATSSWN